MSATKIILKYILISAIILSIFSCEKDENEPTPTNDLMEGVWKLNQITDTAGIDITDNVMGFFPGYLHLDDANTATSTVGPLFMYIIYGDSKFINITSKFDEIFKYADIQLTQGEWFIDKNKTVDNFTIEIKMRFPTAETFNEAIQILDLPLPEAVLDAVDIIIYHKFKYTGVYIDDEHPDVMTWNFNKNILTEYTTKDDQGDKQAFTLSTNSFTKCNITWVREVKSINSLVEETVANNN